MWLKKRVSKRRGSRSEPQKSVFVTMCMNRNWDARTHRERTCTQTVCKHIHIHTCMHAHTTHTIHAYDHTTHNTHRTHEPVSMTFHVAPPPPHTTHPAQQARGPRGFRRDAQPQPTAVVRGGQQRTQALAGSGKIAPRFYPSPLSSHGKTSTSTGGAERRENIIAQKNPAQKRNPLPFLGSTAPYACMYVCR